jgi:hypothetical protein
MKTDFDHAYDWQAEDLAVKISLAGATWSAGAVTKESRDPTEKA